MSSSQCTFFKKLKLTEIFIEVTVASHAVVSNNTQGDPSYTLPSFSQWYYSAKLQDKITIRILTLIH